MLSKSQLYKGIFFFQNTNAIMCDWKKKKRQKTSKPKPTKTKDSHLNQTKKIQPKKNPKHPSTSPKNTTQTKPKTYIHSHFTIF